VQPVALRFRPMITINGTPHSQRMMLFMIAQHQVVGRVEHRRAERVDARNRLAQRARHAVQPRLDQQRLDLRARQLRGGAAAVGRACARQVLEHHFSTTLGGR
jgi:hypothetical protein